MSIRDGETENETNAILAAAGGTTKKPEKLWNTALFFPCMFPDDPRGSLAQLLYYLKSAEKSLKICVMILSYDAILEAILDRHKAGVVVKVFTSYNSANEPNCAKAGKLFRAHGVPIRSMEYRSYSTEMHHKYAIVDDEAILTGSMNWNALSITQQRENILVTTNPQIVAGFIENFDLIWSTTNREDQENANMHQKENKVEPKPLLSLTLTPPPVVEDQADQSEGIFASRKARLARYEERNKQRKS